MGPETILFSFIVVPACIIFDTDIILAFSQKISKMNRRYTTNEKNQVT